MGQPARIPLHSQKPLPNPGSPETRAHSRHDWPIDLQIAWLDEVRSTRIETLYLRAQNLSIGGIGLRSRCMIHPGQIGVILLEKGTGEALMRGVEVHHCQYSSEHQTHIIGCGWVEIPTHIQAQVVDRGMQGTRLEVEDA